MRFAPYMCLKVRPPDLYTDTYTNNLIMLRKKKPLIRPNFSRTPFNDIETAFCALLFVKYTNILFELFFPQRAGHTFRLLYCMRIFYLSITLVL